MLIFLSNAIAFGTHDDDGEVGSIAKGIGTTLRGLQPVLKRIEEQGLVEIRRDFVYPTPKALRLLNPVLTEKQVKAALRKLR